MGGRWPSSQESLMLANASPLYISEVARNQYVPELDAFAKTLATHSVRSYLEIGARFGCSLWRVAHALPQGSLIVAVDLPTAYSESQVELQKCIDALVLDGYDAHLILGDSKNANVIAQVKEFAPFDACLIDGDHTLAGVKADWLNYGPLCRIVGLHDIAYVHDGPHRLKKLQIDVPELWAAIRDAYVYGEIKMDPSRRSNGIGIIFREDED